MCYYRNPMWLLFTGISTSDTYRLEVVTTVEYVPTLTFDSWSPSEVSKVSRTDVTPMFKSIS
jgi:hypothetical protein